MFYRLKRAIMCRALDKRNKQKPFDYQAAECFSLEGGEDVSVNDSYYFSAHNEEMSFYARLGRRVHIDETWVAVYLDGKLYSLQQEIYPSDASPLKVERDGEKWLVSFKGHLTESDELDFHATFSAGHDPIDFTSHMPALRMATGVANEKWNRAFFNELQGISGQCHYEQEGILEGKLTLNGRTLAFNLPCVRDHSFGKRDWNYMNNHLWLMAVSPACQFNYSLVSYPVMSVLEVGNYRDRDGMHYLLEADLDFNEINRSVVPRELSFSVKLDNGQKLPVSVRQLAGVTYHFQDGDYILIENIAAFQIGPHSCRGILEIGFNHDSNRYFNQRDLNTIKR